MSVFDGMGARPAAAPAGADELARFDLNDDGNALRFIRTAGGVIGGGGDVDLTLCTILYLRDRGWIAFNGRCWDLKTGLSLATRHAIKVARGMAAQMEIRAQEMELKSASAKAIQAVREFGLSCGNKARIGNMMALAQVALEVDLDAFDVDPLALNVANGVIRFRNGLHVDPVDGMDREGPHVVFTAGHRAEDRFTRIAKAAWNPKAEAPLFQKVLREAQPKEETRRFVQRVQGYVATGDVSEQAFFVYQGKGGDGKSTVVNATAEALGTYSTTVAIETFLDTGVKRGGEASPDIAALAGDSRMLCAGEPPSGSKLATGEIKRFTGGGKIKARELREGLFEFEPIGKVLIECNRRPTINDTDNGIWRRLKIVPWPVSLPEDQQDRTIPKRLKGEIDGILTWIAEGVLAWMAEGLGVVADVKEAIEDYRKGANPFVQWFDDCVIREEGARTGATVLFKSYIKWMEDNGYDKPMSQKAFGATLGDLQIVHGPKDGDGKATRLHARLRTLNDPPVGGAQPPRASPPASGPGGSESSGVGGGPAPDGEPDWEDQ